MSVLLCAFAGTGLALVGADEYIESITVTKGSGNLFDFGPGDQPDLYLVLETSNGSVETERYEDTPIGNGLTWELDPNVRRGDLSEVTIWDHDMMRDDCLDRVRPTDWKVDGQKYTFEFHRRPSTMRPWLLGISGVCGLMLLVTGGLFVRDQVL